jgi:hypothetical protein
VLERVASSDAASCTSDRSSLKARAAAFRDGNPARALGRVTTPDITETQNVRKTEHKRVDKVKKGHKKKATK